MINTLKLILLPLICVLALSGCNKESFETLDMKNECTPIDQALNFVTVSEKEMLSIEGKGITQWIRDEVTSKVWLGSTLIYLKIAFNIDFRFTVAMMMTLAVIFFAASVLLGIIQANGYNMLMFIIKLVIIYQLTINYIYFQMYVIQTFEAIVADATMFATFTFSDYVERKAFVSGVLGQWSNIGEGLQSMFGGDFLNYIGVDNITNKLDIFYAIDLNLSNFFSFDYIKMILALGGFGYTGIFSAFIMLATMVTYFLAIVLCIKVYLMAYIARFVLYALGPLFISFALFNQTRSLFDGWLQQLINFTLQPVFLFIFFGMFHSITTGMLQQTVNNLSESTGILIEQCEQSEGCSNVSQLNPFGTKLISITGKDMCLKVAPIEEGKDAHWYRLCYGDDCESNSIAPNSPIDVWALLMALIMCYIMFAMCGWVTSVASQISSGMVTFSDVKIAGWDRFSGSIKQGVNSQITRATNSLIKGGGDDKTKR
jgi:type IV secretory pathway VirB6-like protein